MQDKMINDLTQGNVTKKLILFSVPFILASLLQTLYSMVDMIVVGQFVGKAGVSAVSIGSQSIQLLTAICMGFSTGGQILLSQLVGAKNEEGIQQTIGTMFTFILSISLVFTVVGIVFADFLLNFLNTPIEAFEAAKSYLVICSLGMIFIYGYNVVCTILRGMGDSKRPLIFVFIAAVVNMVLDIIFVGPFKMGVAGAAYATVISQALSFIFSIFFLMKYKEKFGFDFKRKSFRIHMSKLKPLITLGVPQALQHGAVILSFMIVNSFMNEYGVVASAVSGIGFKLNSIVQIVTFAMSGAGSTMIAQNLGANQPQRAKAVVNTSLFICLSFAGIVSVVCMTFPQFVFSLFNQDAEVLAMAGTYMPYAVVSFCAFAFMAPYSSMVTGVGYAAMAFVVGLLDGIVARVGLSYLFGCILNLGLEGYWLGSASAGFVTGIISAVYYYSNKWKTRKLMFEERS